MWIDVVIRYASDTDTSVETQCGTSSPIASSSSEPIAGSPRKPRPSEVSVMPTCAADRYRDRSSIMLTAVAAPRLPAPASVWRCALCERTSANSAATKNALRRTRTRTASSSRAIIGPPYFEEGRLSSGRRAEDSVDPLGHRAVVVGQLALGVRRQCQPHLVPAVDEDVRVVVGLLGGVGHLVDECHRLGEVLELIVANQRLVLLPPY